MSVFPQTDRLGTLRTPSVFDFANPRADGVTDDSVAIKAAHDAAAAAGVRELFFPRGNYYAPNLQNVGNVHFRGPGRLIGAYRKQVIPYGARAAAPFFATSDCVPATHLRQFARALNPVVVIVGDSTGVGGNALSSVDFIVPRLQEMLARQNANRTVTFYNRCIGGTTWANVIGNGVGLTLPSWWTGPATDSWLGVYVQPLAPDLVVWNLGTNGPDGARYFNINAAMAVVNAWTKPPSHLFLTNLPRSVMADTASLATATQASAQRDQAASAVRNHARLTASGLIDFHRMACMARDGFDPADQRFVDSGLSSVVFPAAGTTYDLPETVDFDIRFTVDNSTGIIGGSGGFDMSFYYGGYHNPIDTSQNGPRMRLVRSGSALQYSIVDSGGAVWKALTPTGIAMTTSAQWVFQVQKRQGWMRALLNDVVFHEQMTLDRGGLITPYLSRTTGAIDYTINYFRKSEPMQYVPSITDAEMFGAQGETSDGNGVNHPASRLFPTVTGPLLTATNLCADDLSTGQEQTITAAGAINTRAAHVKITGPSSGTYAITLAAPGRTDGGRTMVIEMISTTATNAVTLALTNVIGGTASTTASFDAAQEILILTASNDRWVVTKQQGVTLT